MRPHRCKIIDIDWDTNYGFHTSETYSVDEMDALDLAAYCEPVVFDRVNMIIEGRHVNDTSGLLKSVGDGHLYRCMKDKYVFIEDA